MNNKKPSLIRQILNQFSSFLNPTTSIAKETANPKFQAPSQAASQAQSETYKNQDEETAILYKEIHAIFIKGSPTKDQFKKK